MKESKASHPASAPTQPSQNPAAGPPNSFALTPNLSDEAPETAPLRTLRYSNPSEQVQAELEQEMEKLYAVETSLSPPDNSTDDQVRTTLSKAFFDLHSHLARAVDLKGNPHPVLRAFGRHLLLYLLIPSAIASRPPGLSLYTYQPFPGLSSNS